MQRTIGAGKFKAECLQIMDRVNTTKKPIVITKRNRPIVKLVPFEEKKKAVFGVMKGTVTIKGDIVSSIDEDWDACR